MLIVELCTTEIKMSIRRCTRLLLIGKENLPRFLKLEIDDGPSFKPELPKFKQKGVAVGLQL